MAELVRQSSRERFMLDFLRSQVGLSDSTAQGYVAGLVDEGYDTEEVFLSLSPEELRDDFEWKKGHVKKFEIFLAQRSATRQAPDAGGGALSAEDVPVGISGGGDATNKGPPATVGCHHHHRRRRHHHQQQQQQQQ